MDVIKDLFIRDEEGEGTAFLIAIFTLTLAVGGALLIVYLILGLIVRVVRVNPQSFWRIGIAGLLASLQGPIIYNPEMDAKLIAGWQLVQPVAIATVLVLLLYLLAVWAKSRGKKLLGQIERRRK